MADKKQRPQPRELGKSRFRLPEQSPRPSEPSPAKDILAEALAPTTHLPPTTRHPPPTTPVAPERDFVRVPNSVVRDALAAGLFKGESKKTYDALYQRTRGAVVPRRVLRATLAEVMAWANVSHNTLKAHLKHLARVGLVKVHYVRGDNTGAEYEVFTPEEAPPTTHQPQTTHLPATVQNVAPPTSQNLVLGGGGQTVDYQRPDEPDKTSFKTNTEKLDDEVAPASKRRRENFEVLASSIDTLDAASKQLTGKGINPAEASKWQELFEVLATELKIAAGRTTVSSVPAFLAEHLRRRLWKKDKRQLDAETAAEGQGAPKKGITGDISECPDCGGSGWAYPNGYEGGVARCRHEQLASKTEEGK